MNGIALSLMSPRFQKMAIKGFLDSKYPRVAAAYSGSRLCRSRGHDERYVFLYTKPTRENPNGEYLGRCKPETIQLFVDAGEFQHCSARFTDHQPDTGYEQWYRYND